MIPHRGYGPASFTPRRPFVSTITTSASASRYVVILLLVVLVDVVVTGNEGRADSFLLPGLY